ncbi:MAG: DUF1799 domain-containing protein [Alphaproteobacteria bacterium]
MARALFDRRHPKPISKNGLDGLKALGAPPAVIKRYTTARAKRPRLIMVHPDNWQAVSLFLGSMTQWRVGLSDHNGLIRTGLDYQGLRVVADAEGVSLDRALLAKVQKIETEAMTIWSEQKRSPTRGAA